MLVHYVNPITPAQFERGAHGFFAIVFVVLGVSSVLTLQAARRARRRGKPRLDRRIEVILWVGTAAFLLGGAAQVTLLFVK